MILKPFPEWFHLKTYKAAPDPWAITSKACYAALFGHSNTSQRTVPESHWKGPIIRTERERWLLKDNHLLFISIHKWSSQQPNPNSPHISSSEKISQGQRRPSLSYRTSWQLPVNLMHNVCLHAYLLHHKWLLIVSAHSLQCPLFQMDITIGLDGCLSLPSALPISISNPAVSDLW